MNNPKLKVFGKKLAKGAGEFTPLIGEVLENLDSEANGKGKFSWRKFGIQLARLAIMFAASKYLGVQIPI